LDGWVGGGGVVWGVGGVWMGYGRGGGVCRVSVGWGGGRWCVCGGVGGRGGGCGGVS